MTSTSHAFDTSLAKKYGVHEAIIIHHFQHWIKINIRSDKRKNSDKHYKDGHHWTYQTAESISDHFEYLSLKQVRRIVDKLEDLDVIIKGNYNDNKYDQTKWYAFNDEELFLQVSNNEGDADVPHREMPKRADRRSEKGRPIPDTKPDTNTKDTYVSFPELDKQVQKSNDKIKFNRDKKEFENMSEEFLDSLKKIAPSVNINTELERIKDWLLTHPNGKRKKAFERFIKQWIKKAEDTIQYNKIKINKKRGNLEWELSQKKKLNQYNTEHLEAGTKMQKLEELKCLELTTKNY